MVLETKVGGPGLTTGEEARERLRPEMNQGKAGGPREGGGAGSERGAKGQEGQEPT